jgi:hypothetical protein
MTFARTALIGGLATLVAPLAMAQDAATSDLPIAVQMYTLRDHGTLDEQLVAVQAAGVTVLRIPPAGPPWARSWPRSARRCRRRT